jgi:hypothetical protein
LSKTTQKACDHTENGNGQKRKQNPKPLVSGQEIKAKEARNPDGEKGDGCIYLLAANKINGAIGDIDRALKKNDVYSQLAF